MSEQLPEGHAEKTEGTTNYAALYKEAHPGAVADIRKAEHMAYATDADETAVVENRKKALEHAGKIGEPSEYNHLDATVDYVEAAHDAREVADGKAREVAGVYDATKDRGIHPDVDDVRKAEHMAYATDAEETAVVEHRKHAMERAAVLDEHPHQHTEAVHEHVQAAQAARKAADEKAKSVGRTYEATKDL